MPAEHRLPGAPFLARRADSLHLEDCRLDDLAARHGTPLYVYSRSAMRAALSAYTGALAGRPHLLCYAMKANSSLAVLQTFAEAGCGFDIVSGGELERALAVGVDGSRIVFSGVGKTRADMRRALDIGVRCFNVESEAELEVLSAVAVAAGRVAPVSLRVNPDVDAGTHPYISTGLKDNKFGIAHEQALQCYRRAAGLPGLRVVGIDCHIGSQITEIPIRTSTRSTACSTWSRPSKRKPALKIAASRPGRRTRHHLHATRHPPAPGDLIAAGAASGIDARGHGAPGDPDARARPVAGRQRRRAGSAKCCTSSQVPSTGTFCVVDAAMNDLMRPALYEAWMDDRSLRGTYPAQMRRPCTWDVVGPICESGDWLGRDRHAGGRRPASMHRRALRRRLRHERWRATTTRGGGPPR